jgi:hypothetical protein
MLIAVDFDGTCVTHEYPIIGKDIGAVPVLKKLVAAGHELILWTMRSDQTLEDAVNWFKTNELPLYGANENPTQIKWTRSPKVYAHIYLDDAALGCPTKMGPISDRPFVDWQAVELILTSQGILIGTNGNS